MKVSVVRLDAQAARTIALGVLSLVLYVLLFTNAETVLLMSVKGGWGFLVPIGIAFLFSFVHGAFTGGFWDMVGLKANTRKEPKRWNK
jgi:uncharacterized integral membrane protein